MKDRKEVLHKDMRQLLGVMGMLIILIVVMASHVYTYVKTYQIAHFKYVQLIVHHYTCTSIKLQTFFFLRRNIKYSLQLKSTNIYQASTLWQELRQTQERQRQTKQVLKAFSFQGRSFKAISCTHCIVTILWGRDHQKLWQWEEPKCTAWISVNSLPSLPLRILNPQIRNIFLHSLILELQNIRAGTVYMED